MEPFSIAWEGLTVLFTSIDIYNEIYENHFCIFINFLSNNMHVYSMCGSFINKPNWTPVYFAKPRLQNWKRTCVQHLLSRVPPIIFVSCLRNVLDQACVIIHKPLQAGPCGSTENMSSVNNLPCPLFRKYWRT